MSVERATPEAFERFFLAEHPRLVALGLAWSSNRETARDLAQRALARAHRQWSMVGLLDLPGAWVRRAMINLLIDDRRDAERRRRIADRVDGADSAPGPEMRVHAWWQAVRALPDRERAAVTLHFIEDLSIAEVAGILEVQPGTVRASLSHARENARAALSHADESQRGGLHDHDLDALGRRAAAAVRAQASSFADSRAALDGLLGSFAPSGEAPGAVAVEPDHAGLSRRRWPVPAVAAAVAILVLGVAILVRSGAGTIDIVGPGRGTGSGVPLPSNTSIPPTGGTTASTAISSPGSAPTSGATSGTPASTVPASTTPESTVAVDPSAAFTPPAGLSPPTLDDVPRLLPTARAVDPDRTFGADSTSGDAAPPVLSQLWVRADGDGAVTAVVHLRTRPAPAAPNPNGVPVEVDGWPDAVAYPAGAGYSIVTVVGRSGIVEMWSFGLSQDELVQIGGELTAADTGWRAATLEGDGWTALDTTWTVGSASRSITALDQEGDIDTELRISRGVPLYDIVPWWSEGAQLVDVAGGRAVAFNTVASGLFLTRDDGTTVVLGSRDPDADLVAVAESLVEVDQARWDDASELTIDPDGCLSLFC